MLFFQSIMLSIAPQQCLICDEFFLDFGVCEVCFSQLNEMHPPRCEGCGKSFPPIHGDFRCLDCMVNPEPFTHLFTSFDYLPIAGKLIHEAKAMAQPRLLTQLWSAVDVASLDKILDGVDVIVPIPDRKARFRKRGFSTARMIANRLSVMGTRLPIKDHLRWRKRTACQTTLSRTQRQLNVEGSLESSCVKGLRVLVVDDVATTMSTVRAASKALRRAGSSEVRVYALCRKT